MHRSQATIDDDFLFGSGTLTLDASLLTIGDEFWLGSDSLLRMDIAGLLRGTEYGAIDTGSAFLIENDRYRLYVAPVGVPEPPTAALLVAALALLSLQRRRAACRAAR